MTDPVVNSGAVATDATNATGGTGAAAPAAADTPPPTLADLMAKGQAALDAYTPLAQVVADDNVALVAAQKKLQDDTVSQATALANVQAIGHQIVAAVQAQYLITG